MRNTPLGPARHLTLLLTVLALGACSSPPPSETIAAAKSAVVPVEVRADDPVLAAVGDIGACDSENGDPARATAALLLKPEHAGIPILALGDLAYGNGTQEEFAGCYDRVWGSLKGRTRPSPGNHDYGIYLSPPRANAEPYFAYFGTNAGPDKTGHYSFDVGSWHIVSLNSMAGQAAAAPAPAEQIQWLEADLAQAAQAGRTCTLAFWHHPFFTSGEHGEDPQDPGRDVGPLWDTLAGHHADVIVNGHDHDYEQFALQTRQGKKGIADAEKGIRQFVVGTGGARIRPFQTIRANSQKRLDGEDDHGVLFLKLHSNGYGWSFVRTDGTLLDQSTEPQACHSKV